MQKIKFNLPSELHASRPPELRGRGRGDVRMMVLYENGELVHRNFNNVRDFLNEGDLLILNNSRTLPAELTGNVEGELVRLRLSRRLSDNQWEGLFSVGQADIGDTIRFDDELTALVTRDDGPFVHLLFSKEGVDLLGSFYTIGEPIRYEYILDSWELERYQTVYGTIPGSVEMTSAGRAITWELLFSLQEKGVQIGYVTLHTGLSDLLQENWSPNPSEHLEEYHVSEETAGMVNKALREGRRIIAVGTTVVRAIETAFDSEVRAGTGLTNLYINSTSKLNVINGLLTGFHEPEASHLDMLSAFVSEPVLRNAYNEAVNQNYLWHEFGDVNLILSGEKQ